MNSLMTFRLDMPLVQAAQLLRLNVDTVSSQESRLFPVVTYEEIVLVRFFALAMTEWHAFDWAD